MPTWQPRRRSFRRLSRSTSTVSRPRLAAPNAYSKSRPFLLGLRLHNPQKPQPTSPSKSTQSTDRCFRTTIRCKPSLRPLRSSLSSSSSCMPSKRRDALARRSKKSTPSMRTSITKRSSRSSNSRHRLKVPLMRKSNNQQMRCHSRWLWSLRIPRLWKRDSRRAT